MTVLRDEMKVKEYVTNRASYDFDCPKDKIEVGELESRTFAATGCGKKGVYSCKYPEAAWYEARNMECKSESSKK
jgi:hypothetical protein